MKRLGNSGIVGISGMLEFNILSKFCNTSVILAKLFNKSSIPPSFRQALTASAKSVASSRLAVRLRLVSKDSANNSSHGNFVKRNSKIWSIDPFDIIFAKSSKHGLSLA